jgi:hypothetical protein|tara:strand:- start:242 stop:745 length:504 start_codon:yes stop_codon:yes gene_type:complete
MGYSKNTSKTATALDYAQIDHYKQSTVAGLMGQTIDPLDMSVENISQYANRNLDKGVSSKGYNFHSSNKGTNYALELGLPEVPNQNTIMDNTEKNISREALGMEKMVGANFENKDIFEQNQMATRSFNPAESMISASPDFSVPLDETPIKDYNNQGDELGGLVTGLS